MYQGNNPTALNSQKLLLDALHELIAQKEFNQISVSELCSHSGVSRQTFYSLFGTKENMLRFRLEQVIQTQRPTQEHAASVTLCEMCEQYGDFVVENFDQLKLLVDSDLPHLLNELFYGAMSSCHDSYVGLDDEERDYAALFMSAGLSRLTWKYIQLNKTPCRDELARLSYKIMSGKMYRQ